jgi:TP901 family phage tail tape measure protein
MAINNDIITLEVKVKASDAHSELNKLQKDLSSLRDELTAAGKSSDEFTKDERYRALIERINELHGALKKQNSEYAQSFKTNEQTFMELIKARFKEESASLKELEQLRRHLRAKQSGTREGSEDWQKNIKELAEVENKIEKIKDEIKQVKNEMKLDGSIFKSAETIGKASFNQLTEAAEALQYKLKQLDPTTEEFIEASKRLSIVNNRLNEVKQSTQEVSKSLLDAKQILNSAAGYLGAEAVSEGLQVIYNTFDDGIDEVRAYGKALSELEAITGASGDSLSDLEKRANNLTEIVVEGDIKITNSAANILKAFKLVGSAKPELLGNTQALEEMTHRAIVFQKSSGLELPDAVKYLTSTMAQFNGTAKESDRYINAIAAGAKEGATEIPDISSAIEEFGAGAASANFSIEESIALVETLGDKMIKGNEAGTALRNILLTIKAPDALSKEAQAALKAYNVDMSLLKDTSKTGGERLKELSKIVNDASAMVTVFGKENVTAAEILLRNTNRFEQLTKAVTGTNEAYRQAGAMSNNLDNDLDNLKDTAKGLFTEVGTRGTGTMRGFVQSLTEGIKWVKEHIDLFVILTKIVLNAGLAYGTYIYSIKAAELAQKALTWATGVHNTAIAVWRGEITMATIAMNLFNKVSSINPLAAIAAFFTTAISLAVSFTSSIKNAISIQDELNKKSIQEKATVEQLISTLKDEHTSRETKKAMITKLNEMYPEILKNYDLEKGDIKDLTKLQNELNKAIESRIATEMRDEAVKEIMIDKVKTQIQLNKLREMRSTATNDPVDEFGNTKFDVLDAQIEAAERRLGQFDNEIKKTNDSFKALGYSIDKLENKNKPTIGNTGSNSPDDKFEKGNKKKKTEVELLAGSVAFLRDEITKLNKEFENSPESKTPEIAEKMATATKALADAEDKLNKIRTEALKKAFGRKNFDDIPQIETLNVVEVQKKIKGRQEANDSGNAQTIKSISPEKNQDVLLAKAIADIELDIKKRGHQKKYEEEQKYQAKIQELIKGGLEATRIASDAIFQIQAQNSEYRKNEELKRVEDIYKKRLDKAKGNTKETVRLEKELDDKRRQIEKDAFERDKKRSIIQAIMNGAMAITKILAEYPKFDFGIATAIGIGLAAATTAAQVAVISNQKFEKGGVVRGASHTEGGIKLFDTKSKSIVGEMEGDEPYLILSKNTYKNNKDIVDALIDSSQNRNGASVMANGGIVQPNATATAPIRTVYTNSTTYREPTYVVDLSQMAADVKEIKTAFESFPREFKGYIVYQDLKDNQDIVEQVKNKAFGR